MLRIIKKKPFIFAHIVTTLDDKEYVFEKYKKFVEEPIEEYSLIEMDLEIDDRKGAVLKSNDPALSDFLEVFERVALQGRAKKVLLYIRCKSFEECLLIKDKKWEQVLANCIAIDIDEVRPFNR